MLESKLKELFQKALENCGIQEQADFVLSVPPKKEWGDFATNIALVYGKKIGKPPRELASQIAEAFAAIAVAAGIIDPTPGVNIQGPGFINFFVANKYLQESLKDIHKQDAQWGHSKPEHKEHVLIEFVSANPTGPLHVGHGRWAVVGDVIARLLRASGHEVKTEYYLNDVGNQIDKLIASIKAVEKGEPVPEGGYGGAYIKDLAGKGAEALELIIKQQTAVLDDLGVRFDTWFSESVLHKDGLVKKVIEDLTRNGFTYVNDGATWFKSTEFGDEKDRVLVKADGATTYFAADIAYHLDKFKRSGDRLINIWGADHHGYVKRVKAAMRALGRNDEKLEIIIGQLVSLFRGAEVVRMSKRTGEMVTLAEVVEETGADATRFFFSMTDVNSHLNFDLELAKKKSNDNPVFYVQYAHARICSILKRTEDSVQWTGDLSELTHPAERTLILKLLAWPELVKETARLRHPHRITEYGKELATVFHSFYEQCKVLGNPSRIVLVDASRITLRNVLELLGISAPEKM